MHFQAITKQEAIKFGTEIAKKCQAQEKESDLDVAEFLNHQVPTTEPGNCLYACFMETVGMVCQNILF